MTVNVACKDEEARAKFEVLQQQAFLELLLMLFPLYFPQFKCYYI